MASSQRTQVSCLIWLAACLCVVSRKPAGPNKGEGESDKGQKKTKEIVLSKEQIIKIANREARRLGRNLSRTDIVYDDDNAGWKQVAPGPWPQREGHDYQAVSYWHKEPTTEGGLWILVDRNTGDVLMIGSPP
jgi:hypothetical protein